MLPYITVRVLNQYIFYSFQIFFCVGCCSYNNRLKIESKLYCQESKCLYLIDYIDMNESIFQSNNSVRMDFLKRKIQFNLYYIQYIHNARYTSLVEFTLRIIKATIYVRIMDDLKTDNYLHLHTSFKQYDVV